MGAGSFSEVIEAHLELQRRNSRLERSMPISRYKDTAGDTAAAEAREVDPPTENAASSGPWDDPDSWWNVREPLADWST